MLTNQEPFTRPSTVASALVALLGLHAVPSQADSLFGQNPYDCVFAAKRSVADDATRRSDLAGCMFKVTDTAQALRALESANFHIDYVLRSQIESKIARGERWYARALLDDAIVGRPQTAAREQELKAGATAAAREMHVSLCLSNPERASPSRDEACRDVPGFRNSTGRVNPYSQAKTLGEAKPPSAEHVEACKSLVASLPDADLAGLGCADVKGLARPASQRKGRS